MLSTASLAFLIIGQGAGFTDALGTYARTGYVTGDGASFSIHAYYPDVMELPEGVTRGAGRPSETTDGSCYVSVGAGRAFQANGTATFSETVQFYFCGVFTGSYSDRPQTMSATSPKMENCSATTSYGDTATGSTSNNSASASNGTTSNPPAFKNEPSVSAVGTDWKLQEDGTYRFWNYAYTNTLSVTASHPKPAYGQAGAGAKVTFNIAKILATHPH